MGREAAPLADLAGTHAVAVPRPSIVSGTGAFSERDEGLFELTPASVWLRSGVPGSMRRLIMLWGAEAYRAFGDLLHSVNTGEPTFDHVYATGIYQYLTRNPEPARIFNEALLDWVHQNHAAVAHAYDFSRFNTIVDGRRRSGGATWSEHCSWRAWVGR